MKVNVTFRSMDVDTELMDYVKEKVEKISEKYLHRPKDATATPDATTSPDATPAAAANGNQPDNQ